MHTSVLNTNGTIPVRSRLSEALDLWPLLGRGTAPAGQMTEENALVLFPIAFGRDDSPAVTVEIHTRTIAITCGTRLFGTALASLLPR